MAPLEPNVREPKRGTGVPREQRGGTLVSDLAATLAPVLGPDRAAALVQLVEAGRFYERGLTAQRQLLEQAVMEVCAGPERAAAALGALEAAEREPVRGLAPGVAYRLYHTDPDTCLPALCRTGSLSGTWPQEAAQGCLKGLMIEHGVAPILERAAGWTADPDPAVRRLLVEALRPMGVWVPHLRELRRDPAPLHDILEQVLDDPSDYVRAAAANNLNDIARDHPGLVCAWCAAWQRGPVSAARRRVIRHGLRTLLRQGHPEAQALVGLAPADQLAATWLGDVPAEVRINEVIGFRVEVRNRGSAPAAVRLQAVLAGPGRGGRPRRKVYQVGRGTVPAGASALLRGQIHFVDRNSAPRLPGEYRLTLQANGADVETRTFRHGDPDRQCGRVKMSSADPASFMMQRSCLSSAQSKPGMNPANRPLPCRVW